MKFKMFFVLFLKFSYSYALWSDVKDVGEKIGDIENISEAVMELSGSIADETELENKLRKLQDSSSQVRSTLRDLDYTHSEINDILKGDQSGLEDIASTIYRSSRRIRRAKNMVHTIKKLLTGSSSGVVAVQAMETNQTLREIHSELTLARMDRMMEKDQERIKILNEKMEEKKEIAFFKEQFSLMRKKSGMK